MAPQLPASALAAISGYIDREEPAEPPAPARPAPAAPAAAPPQLPASALAAISGYIDREEPAGPPSSARSTAPAVPADREEPAAPPPVPPPARDREEQTLREMSTFTVSAGLATYTGFRAVPQVRLSRPAWSRSIERLSQELNSSRLTRTV